jgi:hypothetical protein
MVFFYFLLLHVYLEISSNILYITCPSIVVLLPHIFSIVVCFGLLYIYIHLSRGVLESKHIYILSPSLEKEKRSLCVSYRSTNI